MGLNVENTLKFNHVLGNIVDLIEILNNSLGEDIAIASHEDGTEDDPTGLIFLDFPSFMSFSEKEKELFESAVHEADAVNFFVLPEDWIRITFAVLNCWNRESDPYETDVVDIFSNKN